MSVRCHGCGVWVDGEASATADNHHDHHVHKTREKEESTDGMKGQKEGGGQREGREGSRTQIGEGRERTERCLIFSHSYDTYSRRSRAVHCSLPSAHNENMSAGRLGKPGWPHQFETI